MTNAEFAGGPSFFLAPVLSDYQQTFGVCKDDAIRDLL